MEKPKDAIDLKAVAGLPAGFAEAKKMADAGPAN
jgi:hypothetical protein